MWHVRSRETNARVLVGAAIGSANYPTRLYKKSL